MKDIKTLMIGFLLATCMFLMMGQNKGNMGDIVANSLTIENEYGVTQVRLAYKDKYDDGPKGGYIETRNNDGSTNMHLGTHNEDEFSDMGKYDSTRIAEIVFYNNQGSKMRIGSKSGGEGYFTIYGDCLSEVINIGNNPTSLDGMIKINENCGGMIWEK